MATANSFHLSAWKGTSALTQSIPSSREMKVLRGLCLGSVEDFSQWPGAGRGTEDALVAKGWIEPAKCETYGTEGFRITAAGQLAHEAGFNAGR